MDGLIENGTLAVDILRQRERGGEREREREKRGGGNKRTPNLLYNLKPHENLHHIADRLNHDKEY